MDLTERWPQDARIGRRHRRSDRSLHRTALPPAAIRSSRGGVARSASSSRRRRPPAVAPICRSRGMSVVGRVAGFGR